MRARDDLDLQLNRFGRQLPSWAARMLARVRQPSLIWVRIPVGFALVLGGFAGFLPIFGFWMLPLGILLIAQDVPFIRPPLARLIAWIESKWSSRDARDRRRRNPS
jgi:hypothetical protein